MQAIREPQVPPSFGVPARGRVRLFLGRRLLNAVLLALGDVAALTTALLLAALLRQGLLGEADFPAWAWFVLATWLFGAFFLRLLPSWGMAPTTEVKRITELLLGVFGSTAAALFVTQQADAVSRFSLIFGLVLAWPLILGVRGAVKHLLLRARLWGVPTVVYGAGLTGTLMIRALRENPGYGYVPVAAFDDDQRLHGTAVLNVPVLGPTAQVLPQAPIAIVAMPGLGRQRLVHLLDGPLAVYPKVVIVPDLFEIESLWVQTRDFGGMLGLEVARNLLDPLAQAGKRAFDLLAVLLSVPVWVPVCGLLALLIWLEDRHSPIFFQRRVGRHGQLFTTWKFRTMVPNAEEVLRRRLAEHPQLRLEWETHYKLRCDPRVTRMGGLLRKTSLDELPQLVNVLLGQMSLVGPRPLPPYHQEQLSPQAQRLRLRVRPGMTGLWQVSGRSEAGNVGMERWDPYYVRNWSIWLDLVILMRTVGVVLRGSGAY
ncbi:undecaprenyl-phosphate galactose phosphotransferase WbaP [Deinococcus sp. YIM 77859]|uniref:undecaprenyl-phosphate galactose phosphotransferase WbaP n=1 Tax=Deinococcus sp. YIM 77859 TaxID=1540221 RepID=UPI000AFD2328|nr:undecaprenyl-phosphate galactose phosphotransferase WbaP [Deinococcus sp. YIM 77859]